MSAGPRSRSRRGHSARTARHDCCDVSWRSRNLPPGHAGDTRSAGYIQHIGPTKGRRGAEGAVGHLGQPIRYKLTQHTADRICIHTAVRSSNCIACRSCCPPCPATCRQFFRPAGDNGPAPCPGPCAAAPPTRTAPRPRHQRIGQSEGFADRRHPVGWLSPDASFSAWSAATQTRYHE